MLAVRVLIILFLFVHCNCNTHRVQDVIMNRNVVKLINSYIKPMSESFPNHELELQIDIQGPPVHHISQRLSSRRKAHLRKPILPGPTVHKSYFTQTKPKPTTKTTTTTSAPTTQPTTKPPTTARVEKSTAKKEHKEPVYKDDLQKALDELEKKMNKNLLKSGIDQRLAEIVVSNPGPVTGGNLPNINRIIELIRKGVHFQRHVPNTDDSKMDWMQIKIPKSLTNGKKFI